MESKSLKLYLNSFRNHGAFHEECTVAIGKKLVALLKPKWLRIGGYFHPRGGMPIDVFWQAGKLPAGVWVPDQGVEHLSGARIASALAAWRSARRPLAPGSAARITPPMTATPARPRRSLRRPAAALMPPIASTGTRAARAISARPLRPISGP